MVVVCKGLVVACDALEVVVVVVVRIRVVGSQYMTV